MKKVVNWRTVMILQVTWCKTDKKPSNEPFLRTKGQNIVIDNPESAVAVVCYGTWRGSRKYEYNGSIYSISTVVNY